MKLAGYQLIIDYWKKNTKKLIFITIATAIGTIISLSFPYILKLIVDGIKSHLEPRRILQYVAILLGFGILRSGASVFLPFLRGRTNEIFQWVTRSSVFNHILRMGTTFSNRFPSGDVIERLDQDLGELSWFACSGVFRPIEGIFTIIFALIILIKLNPLLTLISVLPVSIAVLVWLKLGPLVYIWYRQWREAMSATSNHIESTFSGIKVVKSYGVETFNITHFQSILTDRINKAVKMVKAEAKIGIFFSGIAELGILIILWVGGTLVIKQRLTLGDFVAFNAYILILITPMFDIGNFFVAGRRAKAGEERISALKDSKPDIATKTDNPIHPAPMPAGSEVTSQYLRNDTVELEHRCGVMWQKIEFNNVCYQYTKDGRLVLQDINLTILPKMKLGIAGTVGSGKSTIIKLLLRVCDPTTGKITIDDVAYPELDLRKLRALFGYAPQETGLFSDTIYNNIVWGRAPLEINENKDGESVKNINALNEENFRSGRSENKSEDALYEYLKITQLDEDLKTFPEKLESQVGERGLTLSGGQKQKVSLARALFGKPEILILDDATSSLDAHTEQQLIQYLMESNLIKTLIVISHRLALLSVCDIIYCLDKGKIIEKGTHQELLTKKGLYWKLYQRQLLEKELEEERI
jgi:ATP-binding cassette subfamily B protein